MYENPGRATAPLPPAADAHASELNPLYTRVELSVAFVSFIIAH